MFENKNLSVLAYANGFTMWLYRLEDSAMIDEDGFFNEVASLMNTGDMIIITTDKGVYMRAITAADGQVSLQGLK